MKHLLCTNLHDTSASLLFNSLVSPRYRFCSNRVSGHTLSEFRRQYPAGSGKSYFPLYCVFRACIKKEVKDRPIKILSGNMVQPRDNIHLQPLQPLHTWETPCGKMGCGTCQQERLPCGASLSSMNAHSRGIPAN